MQKEHLKQLLRKIRVLLPDPVYISMMYCYHMHRLPNLRNPRTFTEKLQWLKLYDRKPEYSIMVDKLLAKDFVGKIIGEEHIIPTLGVWECAEDIDFDALPDQFVLKCNHDSGSIVICRDKAAFDQSAAIEKLSKALRHNGYQYGREWPYKNVRPKVFAEKYMADESDFELKDYKFFCFGGVVKCFKVDFDRFILHRANYYDRDGNLLNFGEAVCPPDLERTLPLPADLEQMIIYAERLSAGVPFLRTDFYNINGAVYFGELTFFPSAGFGKFVPEDWDNIFGQWIELPKRSKTAG